MRRVGKQVIFSPFSSLSTHRELEVTKTVSRNALHLYNGYRHEVFTLPSQDFEIRWHSTASRVKEEKVRSANGGGTRNEKVSLESPLLDSSSDVEKVVVWPKSAREWLAILRETCKDYIETWDGFFNNVPALEKVEDTELKKETDTFDLAVETSKKKKEVIKNTNRNLETIQETGIELMDIAKEKTGINNAKELKLLIAEQIRLANECLSTFMDGYRTGRDDELDKMVNEYFQDPDDKKEKKPESILERKQRRKRRRKRLLTRY